MIRSVMFALVALVFTGPVVAQKPNENLKGYAPFIGTWQFEGPMPEEVPDMAEKGSKLVFQMSWNWGLNKQIVIHDWLVRFENGTTLSGKGLIGWNADDKKIVRGNMDSMGGMNMGTIITDRKAKTISFETEGATGEGKDFAGQSQYKKIDKDTLSFQRLGVTGGLIEGDSPVYTLKRVKPVKDSGVARGAQANEHLKGFAPLIGKWRYEGAVLEAVPGVAEEGSDCVIEVTFRRILDRQVVTDHWVIQYAGGKKVLGRGLIGWNAAENKIVRGAMNSSGGINLGTIEIDTEAKTNTLTAQMMDGEGRKSSLKAVFTKTGKDTITWKALEREGGDVEGESPVYTYKRVKRTTDKKAAK